MAKRRRWEEELEREAERSGKPELARQLADLDEGKRASVLEELQRSGGNRALQQVVAGQQLQRETAVKPTALPQETRTYMRIDGIRGPETRKGHEGEFEVHEFNQELTTGTDPQSGLPTGKRQFKPVEIVIQKSSSLPALLAALSKNEVIKQVVIVEPVADTLMTTTLTGVSVRGIKYLPGGLVRLTLTFQEIDVSGGGQSFADQWSPAVY